MSKIQDFWKYINERHAIYLKRIDGQPSPWSDDPIFQEHKFTNVFRELDPTTIGLRRMLKQLYDEYKKSYNKPPESIMYSEKNWGDWNDYIKKDYTRNQFITCILYRLFNWKGNAKAGPITNPTAWYYYLKGQLDNGQRIMGGNCPYNYQRDCTLESYIEVCRQIVSTADTIIEAIKKKNTLYDAWVILQIYPCVDPLIAYEFACDLRYTDILRNATDVNIWCYISQEAENSLIRLGLTPDLNGVQYLWNMTIPEILDKNQYHYTYKSQRDWNWIYKHHGADAKYPYWELSEIEHCLQQFDKYERINYE